MCWLNSVFLFHAKWEKRNLPSEILFWGCTKKKTGSVNFILAFFSYEKAKRKPCLTYLNFVHVYMYMYMTVLLCVIHALL